jgi:GNAT superfamily N-acetyltransferase
MSSRKTPGGRSASRPDSPSERIKLRIRKARPSDREPLLAMSEGIWGGSDYLPLVLDAWLADEKGVLLTATLDGKPVGLSKVSVLSPGEVWLEGLRLHPDLQGKGLVKQINRASFRAAMRLKPRTVRYSTGAGNAISRHLGEMRGFWLVARTNWLWGAARKGERLSSRRRPSATRRPADSTPGGGSSRRSTAVRSAGSSRAGACW